MKKLISIICIIIICVGGYFFYFSNKEVSYRQKQAVTELNCLNDENIPTIKGLGKGLVVVCHDKYDEKTDKSHSYIKIIDIMKDEIINSIDMEGSYSISQVDQDRVFLSSNNDNCFEIYDYELNKQSSVKVDDLNGYFDGHKYYYLDQNALFMLDIESQKSEQVQVENNFRFSHLSGIENNYLICHPFTTREQNNSCVGLLDLNDGSFIVLNDQYEDLYVNDTFKLLKGYDEKTGYYYSYNIEDQYYGISEHNLSKKLKDYHYLPHTTYLFDLGEVVEGEGKNNDETIIYQLDKKITSCHLKDYDYDQGIYGLTYLEEENLIVGYDQSIVIVDPTLLEFKGNIEANKIDIELKNQKIIDQYNVEPKSTVKGLDQAKKKVKSLKGTYGIDIFLSTDCQKLEGGGFEFKDTSQYDNEETMILNALNQLEEAFQLYPQHFFEQFQTRAGDGGIRIYLVGEIESTYSVIGYEFDSSHYYNIALDISFEYIKQTFVHELWHSMENIALMKDSALFDNWNQLNPKGFEYLDEYGEYNNKEGIDKYTYFGETNINNVYFVDSYSRTYEKEDRARIVEYFMTNHEMRKKLEKSPHIMKKVKKINEVISKTFDIDYEI